MYSTKVPWSKGDKGALSGYSQRTLTLYYIYFIENYISRSVFELKLILDTLDTNIDIYTR